MTKYRVSSGVYSKKTNNSWLVLNADQSSYLELDEIASLIWSKLQKPTTPGSIAKAIAAEYDVDYETALQDVQEFIHTYLKKKLLQEVA